MQRLIIVCNPRSSCYADVQKEVLKPARELAGYMVGKYEVAKIGIDGNVRQLAKLLKDGDMLLAAGGDATGVIAANAIMKSGREVTLAVVPYGNFNDLARTLGTKRFEDVFDGVAKTWKLYPLEIVVDGKHWRYATCYVTVGMMAAAVKLYDSSEMRKRLKTWWGRKVGSYTMLARWYFKNRHVRVFMPEFRLNGVLQDPKVSDYAAVNGKSVARVMKGSGDCSRARVFKSGAWKLTSFLRLCGWMMRSIFKRVPGNETRGDVLEFVKPATVEVQAEGESQIFTGVQKIEIRKAEGALKVISCKK